MILDLFKYSFPSSYSHSLSESFDQNKATGIDSIALTKSAETSNWELCNFKKGPTPPSDTTPRMAWNIAQGLPQDN